MRRKEGIAELYLSKWIILLMTLASPAVNFSGQLEDSSRPPEKSISIYTSDDDVAAFRTIGKILNSSGYDLEDSEEALMTVTTEIMDKNYGFSNLGKLAIKLVAEINMNDTITVIKLSGQYLEMQGSRPFTDEDYFKSNSVPVINSGAAGSAERSAWEYMMEIAKKYRNGKIK
ncbi:MAG: hypothetical protein ACM34K_07435 [Bacillota bacterium]